MHTCASVLAKQYGPVLANTVPYPIWWQRESQ